MLEFAQKYPLDTYLKKLFKPGGKKSNNQLVWYFGPDKTMYMAYDGEQDRILGWDGNAQSMTGGPTFEVLREGGNLPNINVNGPYKQGVISRYKTGNKNEVSVVAELPETFLEQIETDKIEIKSPKELVDALDENPLNFIPRWKHYGHSSIEYKWEILNTKLGLIEEKGDASKIPNKIIAVGVPITRVRNACNWVENEGNILVQFIPASLCALRWALVNGPKEKFLFFYSSSSETLKALIDPEFGILDLRHETKSGNENNTEDVEEIQSMIEEYEIIDNPSIWVWGMDTDTHTFETLKNTWKKLRGITPEELMRAKPLKVSGTSSALVEESEAWLVLQIIE